jgi:soluble lytic murein transglycosylase
VRHQRARHPAFKPQILAAAVLLASLLSSGYGSGGASDTAPQIARLPAGLDPLVRIYPQPADGTLKALKQGIDHYTEGEYAQALTDLAGAAQGTTLHIDDFVILYSAKSSLMLEKFDQAIGLFRLLKTRFPDSSLMQEALLGECRALIKANRADAALAALKNPSIEESPDMVLLRGNALESSGKLNEAIALYLRIVARYVNSNAATAASGRLAALAPGYTLKPANYGSMLERAENLIRAGKNKDARALLLKLAQLRTVSAENAAKRKVLLAQAEYNLGRSRTILPLLKGIPASNAILHSHSLYLGAAVYRRLEDEDSFLALRDSALNLYPQSPFTEKILYSVATYFDVNNRLDECREAYSNLAARFPQGEYAERARWRSSALAYFQHRYDEALNGFWNYFNLHASARNAPATLYWMGRCCDRLGDVAQALQFYERCRSLGGDSYYGQRAAEAERELKGSGRAPGTRYQGIDFAQVFQRAESLIPKDTPISAPDGELALIAERVHELASAGLDDQALAELRWGIRRHPEDRALRYLMSRMYESRADYFGVISTLRRAFPDYDSRPRNSLPREVWELLFPAAHLDVIATQSIKNDVDPGLILGLIRQESAFERQARSRANALGLMQVLPSTGRMLAREAKIPRFTSRKLLQADVNITLGTRHLATLLQLYDRKVEFALAAYNAGNDRVDRWKRNFGDVDMAEFVERIPFGETRDYIKQVLTNAAYYRSLITTLAGGSH